MPRRRKPRLRWAEPAANDLDSIRTYIAKDSPRNADRFIARIRRAVANLRNFPFSGEVLAADEDSELREIYVNSYRVIFRRRDDSILIIAVVHGARRLDLDGFGDVNETE